MVKIHTISDGPATSGSTGHAAPDKTAQASFGSAAIGMSWQLVVVVLLPILGGYKLDQQAHSLPLWTLTGLVVGLVGSIIVIKRALAAFGNFNIPTSSTDEVSKDHKDRRL